MNQRSPANLNSRRRIFPPAFAIALAALAIFPFYAPTKAQTQNQSQQAASPLSFDAASIKERDGSVPLGIVGLQFLPGRIFAHCATLKSLLFYAYNLTLSSPIEGLPAWAATPCSEVSTKDTYDFQATMPPETNPQDRRQMMQTLLADRFKLAVHWEKKSMPVYALVIAPGGSKLKPSDLKNNPPRPAASIGTIGCPPEDRACHEIFMGSGSVSQFGSLLGGVIGRPVIDNTGLTGTYEISIVKWASDTSPDSPLPSLPAALREQLGLELKSQTAPVDVLVIDHAERPTPN